MLKQVIQGSVIRVTKWDTRSLGYGSYDHQGGGVNWLSNFWRLSQQMLKVLPDPFTKSLLPWKLWYVMVWYHSMLCIPKSSEPGIQDSIPKSYRVFSTKSTWYKLCRQPRLPVAMGLRLQSFQALGVFVEGSGFSVPVVELRVQTSGFRVLGSRLGFMIYPKLPRPRP